MHFSKMDSISAFRCIPSKDVKPARIKPWLSAPMPQKRSTTSPWLLHLRGMLSVCPKRLSIHLINACATCRTRTHRNRIADDPLRVGLRSHQLEVFWIGLYQAFSPQPSSSAVLSKGRITHCDRWLYERAFAGRYSSMALDRYKERLCHTPPHPDHPVDRRGI